MFIVQVRQAGVWSDTSGHTQEADALLRVQALKDQGLADSDIQVVQGQLTLPADVRP